MQYDEYISLGSDCEVGFQIRRILGHDSSSYFSWNVTDLQALKRVLENRFEGVLQLGNVSVHGDGGLLNDHLYEYKFHSPFDRPDYENDPAFEAKFQDHREKSQYLIDKFLRERPADHATAYFYKVAVTEEPGAPQRILPEVRDILAGIHGASPFNIIAVMAEDRREDPWGLPRIHNRTLRRIAPWNDAPDGHVNSWDRLFYEFPHKEPMRFSGY
jgi:hypothetical protein